MRALFWLVLSIVLITFIRMVVGIISKGVGDLFESGSEGTEAARGGGSGSAPAGGELKRDPVCGTFVPVQTSVKSTFGTEVVYFCSTECRDKYRVKA